MVWALLCAGALVQVTFKECDTFDLRALKGPSDYVAAANSSETTEKVEACMKVWIKQIEQVGSVRALLALGMTFFLQGKTDISRERH